MPRLERPYPSVLDFLCERFPGVGRSAWERRICEGKVLSDDGSPITGAGEYAPQKRIFYFREVEQEAAIPFEEKILFQNDHLLVACKPHFLPMTPTGPYLDECLLHRLRKSTGNDDLVAVHRLDRETAGVVLFSTNRGTRKRYYELFKNGSVKKSYHAVSAGAGDPRPGRWLVENRMVPGEPWFCMKTEPGVVNARSRIELAGSSQGMHRFVLRPLTGKTHQLRLHLSGLGFPILNDRYYPILKPRQPDDYAAPLQLLAKSLEFNDPLTGELMVFHSDRKLLW